MKSSFPNKNEDEIKEVMNDFYRSFFDFLMETFRLIGMGEKEIRKRAIFENPELLENAPAGRPIVVLGSHLFNWELYGLAMIEMSGKEICFSYQKLSNEFFNRLMLQTRSKFGASGVLRHATARAVLKTRSTENATLLLADQSPVGVAKRYWTQFLHQPTSFYYGIGEVAKLANASVLIMVPRKVKRGYYKVRFEWVAQEVENLSGSEILENYIRILEREIQLNPSQWLWSHRRWKNKPRPEDIMSDRL